MKNPTSQTAEERIIELLSAGTQVSAEEARSLIEELKAVEVISAEPIMSSSSQHKRTPSRESEHSNISSEADVSMKKAGAIFVNFRVTEDASEIQMWVNGVQRPDTILTGQGDHITSYTAILQAILAATDTSINLAMESLKGFGRAVLDEEHLSPFDEIKEPLVHRREMRRKVINQLKAAPETVTEEERKLINSELKYAKLAKRATYLGELTTCLLAGLQQQPLTTVFSKGRLEKKRNEGNLAKQAARGVVAVNQLCRLCDLEDRELEEEVDMLTQGLAALKRGTADTEDDHVMRYGLNTFFEDGGKRADGLRKSLSKSKNISEKRKHIEGVRDELLKRSDAIAMHIGNLYDYQRVLTFNLKEAFGDKDKEWEKEINKYFDPALHEININDGKGTVTVTRTNIEVLSSTLNTHFNIIGAAFPSLIIQASFASIEDIFLRGQVLERSEWEQHTIYAEKEGVIKALDLEELKAEMRRVKQKKQEGRAIGL